MEEKYYKIYVPIEIAYRKEMRLHAAIRDMRPAEFAATILKGYLEQNKIEHELPFQVKAG